MTSGVQTRTLFVDDDYGVDGFAGSVRVFPSLGGGRFGYSMGLQVYT